MHYFDTSLQTYTAAIAPLQVISIDHTPGTTMCVIGLGSAVAKQFGTQEGARSALPVMTPCLAVSELTPQQYTTAMRCALKANGLCCQTGQACMQAAQRWLLATRSLRSAESCFGLASAGR